MKNDQTIKININLTKSIRAADRRERAANDPWFGKRRKSGEIGRSKTKAAASRNACRRKAWA